jgi:hypothetical protein
VNLNNQLLFLLNKLRVAVLYDAIVCASSITDFSPDLCMGPLLLRRSCSGIRLLALIENVLRLTTSLSFGSRSFVTSIDPLRLEGLGDKMAL